MQRERCAPRANWSQKLVDRGFLFAEADGLPYWTEDACYKFTADEIDEIEAATNELHGMCLTAVQRVIDHKLYGALAIPEIYIPYIEKTWEREDPSVYGRFDLVYDGKTPPKMLEYNADTPTSLFEGAVVQWDWLEEQKKGEDQFNSIHEELIASWSNIADRIKPTEPVIFTADYQSVEDYTTTLYMRDTCSQAGIKTDEIDLKDIGWNDKKNVFTTLKEEPIRNLFKLYPWEWMAREAYAENVLHDNTKFIEPAWKMILSNKGILPILWEMYPDHPNLLPTYCSPKAIETAYVKKPLLSREGSGIEIVAPGLRIVDKETPYGKEGHIYQAYQELPDFDGNHPVIGSWVVGGKSCGMGIREDRGPVTGNASRFTPHYFTP